MPHIKTEPEVAIKKLKTHQYHEDILMYIIPRVPYLK